MQMCELLSDQVRIVELLLQKAVGLGALIDLIQSEGDSRRVIGGEIEFQILGRQFGRGGSCKVVSHGGSLAWTRQSRDEVPQLQLI